VGVGSLPKLKNALKEKGSIRAKKEKERSRSKTLL
jgi:hypothetical protein